MQTANLKVGINRPPIPVKDTIYDLIITVGTNWKCQIFTIKSHWITVSCMTRLQVVVKQTVHFYFCSKVCDQVIICPALNVDLKEAYSYTEWPCSFTNLYRRTRVHNGLKTHPPSNTREKHSPPLALLGFAHREQQNPMGPASASPQYDRHSHIYSLFKADLLLQVFCDPKGLHCSQGSRQQQEGVSEMYTRALPACSKFSIPRDQQCHWHW